MAGSLTAWTEIDDALVDRSNYRWAGVAFGLGVFMAVTQDDPSSLSANVVYSSDGENWSGLTVTGMTRMRGITFGSNKFVAVGLGNNIFYTQYNGSNWVTNTGTGDTTGEWRAVAHGNGTFMAVGDGGSMAKSGDGITWTSIEPVTSSNLSAIAYGNGKWIVSLSGSVDGLISEDDGVSWQSLSDISTGNSRPMGLTYSSAEDLFVAACTINKIRISSGDSVGFSNSTMPSDTASINVRSVTSGTKYDETMFVAGLNNGYVLTSTDGNAWIVDTSPVDDNNAYKLMSVAYGNDTFVIMGINGGSGFGMYAQYSVPEPPDPTPIPRCFKSGTYILCKIIDNENTKEEIKQVKVEDLTIGTLVKTKYDGFKPIVKIITGEIKNNPQYQHGVTEYNKNQLYVCSTYDFNELFEDLVITSNHCILAFPISEEKKKQILEFMGDIYVTDEKYRVPACLDERCEVYPEEGTFTIYHFALEKECELSNYGVFANGLLVESASIFDVNSDGH